MRNAAEPDHSETAFNAPEYGWNELDFIDWREFRQMGPPIVKMEIERIERLLRKDCFPEPVADTLRRARLELVRFVADLERCPPITAPGNETLGALAQRLDTAILNAGIHADLIEAADHETIRYVVSRVRYIRNRMNLIYQLG